MAVRSENETNEEYIKLKKQTETVYTFEYFSKLDKNIVIAPQIQGDANLLFYP